MKESAPFTVVSTTRASAPGTLALTPQPAIPAASGTESLLALSHRLLGESDPQRLLQHFFAWTTTTGLADSLNFQPAQDSPAILLGQVRHHSANYRLEVNAAVSGTLTVTRRIRYTEADLAALECGLGFLAPALDLANALQEARKMAMRDALTGLLNRRAMDEALAREMLLAKRQNTPLCLMLLDIDHFKDINDQLGHLRGDRALQLLAAGIRGDVRQSDMSFRLGGDEFAIVLPGTRLAGAAGVARKIQAASPRPGSRGDEVVALKMSIGVAEMLPGDNDKSFLQRADTHLYHAKSQGRGRVCTGV